MTCYCNSYSYWVLNLCTSSNDPSYPYLYQNFQKYLKGFHSYWADTICIRRRGPVVHFPAVGWGLQKKKYHQRGHWVTKIRRVERRWNLTCCPKALHTLVFTGSTWVALADPLQQTGWLIDLKILSLYVVTGKEHKLSKIVNCGTRLCSYIPETKKL